MSRVSQNEPVIMSRVSHNEPVIMSRVSHNGPIRKVASGPIQHSEGHYDLIEDI